MTYNTLEKSIATTTKIQTVTADVTNSRKQSQLMQQIQETNKKGVNYKQIFQENPRKTQKCVEKRMTVTIEESECKIHTTEQ